MPASRPNAVKKRKLREGTRSCWECKRRKIKCVFSNPDNPVCVGCHYRSTPCVSQEVPEELSPARPGNRHIYHRVSKIEEFIEKLGFTGRLEHGQVTHNLPPVRQAEGPPQSSRSLGRCLDQGESPDRDTRSAFPQPDGICTRRFEVVVRHLLDALPSQEDTKILQSISSIPKAYMSLLYTQRRGKLTSQALAAQLARSASPDAKAHPVLLANQMIIFAISLQSPGDAHPPIRLSEAHLPVQRRLIAAASAWVTTQEDMHGTLESLIGVMLEGIFELHCGNLRKSWAICRRARTLAQLMGLHRSPIPPQARIDPELEVDPETMWFRINYIDCYLSILLDLPKPTGSKTMAAMACPAGEPPIVAFEQHLTVVATRIMERNEDPQGISKLKITSLIDQDLSRLSSLMPTSFWHPVSFQGLTIGSVEAVLETLRLGVQVYYFSLIIQLHLPYMMRNTDAAQHDYSKMACVTASREIINRFISHRSFDSQSACSRPVDFFAFYSAMVILLAHIENHQRLCGATSCSLLSHQRGGDLALLDRALEKMELIASGNIDPTMKKSSWIIRKLFHMESQSAAGDIYTSSTVGNDSTGSGELPPNADGGDDQEVLLAIPHIGLVKLHRQSPEELASCFKPDTYPFPENHLFPGASLSNRSLSVSEVQTMAVETGDTIEGITLGGDLPFQAVDANFFSLSCGMSLGNADDE